VFTGRASGPAGEGWLARARRFDLERRLALALTVLAVVCGLATYVVISRAPPYGASVRTVLFLLNLDLVLLLLLGVVIARRMAQLLGEWRQGHAGSRLHTRLVALFSVVAVTPAIIVAVFSVVFLSTGLEAWFSDRVRTALQNSLNVAQAYLEEHKENIRADALAMAADLNREVGGLTLNLPRLIQIVEAQAALRSLTEAIVFDGSGRVLAQTGLGFSLEIETLPQEALDEAAAGEVVTLTSDTDDRVRALARLDGYGDAYLFVGRFVDAQVLSYMERTQSVVSEYEQLESGRSGVQITSALLFMVVALLLLFAAVWIGLNFANRLVAPIGQLIAAANRVRGGDYLARVPETGTDDDELVALSRAFNRMTAQLASQRRELIEANHELERRRRFTETVLAGVTAGVLGVDLDRRIVLPNRSAAAQLLGGGDGGGGDAEGEDGAEAAEDRLVGRTVEEVLPGADALFQRLRDRPGQPVEDELRLVRDGKERVLLVRLAPQLDGERTRGYVLTFDDVTALLSAQRQAAWAEVARRIAHEVKNPLTPIRLSAERLSRKYAGQLGEERQAFQKIVDTIIRQVDAIGRLIGEFSAFARMPAAVLKPEELGPLVEEAVLLQQAAFPSLRFEAELPPQPVELVCDGPKVSQALTNLLQNAAQAMAENGRAGAVRARLRRERGAVVVEVEDEGPGFPAERARLLDPYVTTRSGGTGLGLAIVRKIMEEHAGTVELLSAPGGGALARLTFPDRRG
jgi:two-component system, NtrC family, nitrogen regulation sensor histidine kinase NtrY